MKKIGIAIFGLVAATGSLHAQPDQYLCITEHGAGVHYVPETKSWQPTIIMPGSKYVLRRLKGEERKNRYPDGIVLSDRQSKHPEMSEWGFFNFDERWPRASCDASFNCTTEWLDLHFSDHTGRFEINQVSGFSYQPILTDPPWPDPAQEKIRQITITHPDMGSVQIGTCSAF